MFFLLRLAFWICLVLALLPRDKTHDSDKGPQVSASDAVIAATAAVSDMSQFCTRQPTACAVGGQAASVVGVRAQEGAKKVYDYFTERAEKAEKADKPSGERIEAAEKTPLPPEKPKKIQPDKRSTVEKKNPDHTGSIDAPADGDAESARDTLTQDDRSIEWQSAAPM